MKKLPRSLILIFCLTALTLVLVLITGCRRTPTPPLIIGSKRFTESYVLAEIAKKTLSDTGLTAEHRQGMGGTIIVWEALKDGAISLYPEYTGTIGEEILKRKGATLEQMKAGLKSYGIGMTGELGFNNTYAVCMRRDKAAKLGIRKISDLKQHPELRVGMTHEFLKRKDGWEPLCARYGINLPNVKGIDHALGYAALAHDDIDLKDAYSTDAKIAENNLIVLEDDLNFFPQYKAVFLYRLDTDPKAIAALTKLNGTINEAKMVSLNAQAEKTKNYALAASLYFGKAAQQAARAGAGSESFPAQLAGWTATHLILVSISLALAILVGIPLGIVASRPGPLSGFILGTVGVIQTVPSLALLALLVPIPFFGISRATAIFALFLYSLLPIVRNTATGLQDIPPALREAAAALGLEPGAQLTKIFLPMASRAILAGIKTSAVINVGTATLAALIGAGGLGEPIISGLNLIDNATILQGAIPAAILAILVQFGFDLLERVLIPQGLRLTTPRR